MNKNILMIEPQECLFDIMNKISLEEGDNIYFISSKILQKRKEKNIFHINLLENYEDSLNIIKDLILDKIFYIFTADETHLLVTQKLKNDLGISQFELNEYSRFRDKSVMKQFFKDNAVSTAESKYYKNAQEVLLEKEGFNYPLIIKPTGGYASCGVKRIDNVKELEYHLKKIILLNKTILFKSNNNTGILIEQYIEGEEYAIDTVWFNGTPVVDGIFSKGNDKGPYFPDRVYCVEPDLDENIKSILQTEAHKAAKALGVTSGATHTEIRVMNGVAYVIETALRPGAGGYLYEVLSKAYNIDFHRAYYYASTCDDSIEFNEKCKLISLQANNVESYVWYNMSLKGYGIIGDIRNVDTLLKREEVMECKLHLKHGDLIHPEDINVNYFCWIFFKLEGPNYLEKANKLAEIYDSIISVNFIKKGEENYEQKCRVN